MRVSTNFAIRPLGHYLRRILFLVSISAAAMSSANVTVFSEDFEQGLLGWSVSNSIWQAGMPSSGPSNCGSETSTQCAGTVLAGSYLPNTDSVLESPVVALPTVGSGEEIHLRFRHWFSYSTSDSGQVHIRVFDTSTGSFGPWEAVGWSMMSVSSWTINDVDITDYAGAIVRIGFSHTAVDYCCNGGSTDVSSGWYLDDISIVTATPDFDGSFESGSDNWSATRGIWNIGTPATGPGACFTGDKCAGTVIDGNYQPNTDSRLVGATMSLPVALSGAGLQLRFQNWYSYSTSDSGQLQVRAFDEQTQSFDEWESVGPAVTGVSGAWTQRDVDLTAYSGRTVQLGFLHTAVDYCCNGGSTDVSSGWYIDDIHVVADGDGDFVFDDIDNCTNVFNINQRDTNGDGFGNACDPDLNNDLIVNVVDLGLLKAVFFQTGNLDADLNDDFVVNVQDLGLLRQRFLSATGSKWRGALGAWSSRCRRLHVVGSVPRLIRVLL